MQQFEIILKNERIKRYRQITMLIIMLHIMLFTFLLFDDVLWKKGIGGLAVIALYTLYRLIVAKTSDQKFYFGEGWFFLFSVLTSFIWLIVIDIVISLLCTIAFQKIVFEFNPSFIKQKNFPSKKYEWDDIENLILKDDILTIDLKNNKLIQAEVQSAVNESDFNHFAKQHLQ